MWDTAAAILGMELAEAGLRALALERGDDRDTVPDFAYPKMIDALPEATQRIRSGE